MARPSVLSAADVDSWLAAHPGWSREGDTIHKTFAFPDFATALGFVVVVGAFAERTDHHPDIAFGWGKAKLAFSTHEPPGLTKLDLDGAEHADRAHGVR